MESIADILQIAKPYALIAAIATAVAGLLFYLLARKMLAVREEFRVLRIALEADPTPSQIQSALALFPEAAQYPGSLQKGELIKLANRGEAKRADTAERVMTFSRLAFAAATFSGLVFVASLIFKSPTN